MANRWYKGWWVNEDEYRKQVQEETDNSNKFWGALIICFILYSIYVYFFYKGEADGKDIIALVVCLVIGFIFNRIGSIIFKICLAIFIIAFIIAIVVKLYNYKPHNKAKSDLPLQINTNQNTPLIKEDIRIIQAEEITEEIINTEDTVNTIAESENIDFEKN